MYTRGEKLIAAIIIIAVIAATLRISIPKYFQLRSEADQLRTEAREYENQLRELESRRSDIEKQIESIESDLTSSSFGMATTGVVLVGANEQFLDTAIKAMDDRGLVGIIALCEDMLPGDPGMMSVEDFKSLTQKGWTAVATVDETNTKWWNQSTLDRLGIKKLSGVFFKDGTCPEGFESIVKSNGNIALEKADTKYSDAVKGEMWRVKAADGGPYAGGKKNLRNAIENSESIFYTITIEEGDSVYVETSFNSMLDTMSEYVTAGHLNVTNLATARKQSTLRESLISDKKKELENTKKKLEEELVTVNEKIVDYR